MMIPRLSRFDYKFPDPRSASSEGIVAWGGDLSPTRVLRAYRSGIFPWYSKSDPILWWSVDPRLVLDLGDLKVSRSLKKSMKKFTFSLDRHFEDVVQHCSRVKRRDQEGSWIVPEMIDAYSELHTLGHAHSVECYEGGKLVGGLYGVVVGGVFCGESMFSLVSDASKASLAFLVEHLSSNGFSFIDAQVSTPHLLAMGAKEISRDEFLLKLEKALKCECSFTAQECDE